MTNEEFMWRARMQKKSADYWQHYTQRQKELHAYTQRQKITDWFLVALFWVGLIVAVPVLLVLLVLGFMIDFGPVAPTSVIAFLLMLILFNMGRK